MKQKYQIYIVTHKAYKMPESSIYKPIAVGNKKDNLKDIYLTDDTKDNISDKNYSFCELTAMYWIWKNTNSHFVGINHYRRYLTLTDDNINNNYFKFILNEDQLEDIFKNYDIILPKQKELLFSNVIKHYKRHHYLKDLLECKKIILEKYPEYVESFDNVMKSNKMYICNMLVTKKDIYDNYCNWLFTILFELEKKIDINDYSETQKRVFGFLAERLFNVWISKNNQYKIKEVNLLELEPEKQSIKKIIDKVLRRLLGKKL